MKAEHVQMGYFDIYTKGGKIRRIYIPKSLRKEATEWLSKVNRTTGYLFLIALVSVSLQGGLRNS